MEVTESGFYYFIFANENEIQDNFLSAKFDLHKTGTIHILRKHILRLFGPPYPLRKHVLCTKNKLWFSNPPPHYPSPLQAYVIYELALSTKTFWMLSNPNRPTLWSKLFDFTLPWYVKDCNVTILAMKNIVYSANKKWWRHTYFSIHLPQ